jgi:hypothetical protein
MKIKNTLRCHLLMIGLGHIPKPNDVHGWNNCSETDTEAMSYPHKGQSRTCSQAHAVTF